MDLAFEHYAHVKQEFNAQEYAKICAEVSKPRYSVVNESEAYKLYFQGQLVLPDQVRVIWLHDVERPNDNYLALKMAEMEHEFNFRTSYNIRLVSLAEPAWREDLFKIKALGHEFQYQHEDLVITGGDQAVTFLFFLTDQFNTGTDRSHGLLSGHGSTLGNIAGAFGNRTGQQSFHSVDHTHVDREHISLGGLCHGAYTGGMTDQRLGDRGGDFMRALGNTLCQNAVVCTEYQNAFFFNIDQGCA